MRAIIRERIARVMLGNFGDSKPVGAGVTELRIAFGPGYGVYPTEDGDVIVVLLCGGATQRTDIARARLCWADYKRLVEDA